MTSPALQDKAEELVCDGKVSIVARERKGQPKQVQVGAYLVVLRGQR